jgi:hypothetical protein
MICDRQPEHKQLLSILFNPPVKHKYLLVCFGNLQIRSNALSLYSARVEWGIALKRKASCVLMKKIYTDLSSLKYLYEHIFGFFLFQMLPFLLCLNDKFSLSRFFEAWMVTCTALVNAVNELRQSNQACNIFNSIVL